jgi:hypothetical protein
MASNGSVDTDDSCIVCDAGAAFQGSGSIHNSSNPLRHGLSSVEPAERLVAPVADSPEGGVLNSRVLEGGVLQPSSDRQSAADGAERKAAAWKWGWAWR